MHTRSLAARRGPLGGFLLVCAVWAGAAVAAAQSDRKGDLGVFAPPDALALVGVTDLEQLTTSFEKSAGSKLFNDPAFKDAPGQLGWINRLKEQFFKRLAKALATETDKLKNPFGGSIAFVLLPPSGDSKKPGLVIAAGVKDKDLMREYYTKALSNFKNIADKHEAVEFGSQTIDHFTTRSKSADAKGDTEKPEAEFDPNSIDMSDEEGMARVFDKALGELFTADSLPESFAACLTDEQLVVAFSPDEVKNVFRREKGGDSLREHEDFKSFSRHFESPGPIRVFVNLERLFEVIKAESPDVHKEMMAVLGGKCMRSIIGHAAYGEDKYDSRVEMLLLTSGERTGLMKIMSPKNKPVAAPEAVGRDAVVAMQAAINVPELVDEIERMVRANDPEAADQMRQSMESVTLGEGEKISPRKDVIDNLSEPITIAFGFAKPYTPESPRFQISIGHKNKAALERVIEKVRTLAGMSDRDVKGTIVYDTPLGLSLAITNSLALFGSSGSVDSALQGSADSSLAGDPEFRRCLELAPKEAWATMFSNAQRMYEAAAELAKHKDAFMTQAMTGNISAMMGFGILQGLVGEGDNVDADALRRLSELQSSGFMTIATTPDGVRFSAFNLAPKK